jgi:hypothetical protein
LKFENLISSTICFEGQVRGLTVLERILATFQGKKTERIVWQPRIDHWYDATKNMGTLPRKYQGKELLEIYDDLRASPRTYRFFTPTIKVIQGKNVEMKVAEDEEKIVTTYITPTGKLREVQTRTFTVRQRTARNT